MVVGPSLEVWCYICERAADIGLGSCLLDLEQVYWTVNKVKDTVSLMHYSLLPVNKRWANGWQNLVRAIFFAEYIKSCP